MVAPPGRNCVLTAAQRRVFLPLLAALPVLAVLLALGSWQVQRLHWKQAVLTQLAESAVREPVALDSSQPQFWTKVRVSGVFDHQHEAMLGHSTQVCGEVIDRLDENP